MTSARTSDGTGNPEPVALTVYVDANTDGDALAQRLRDLVRERVDAEPQVRVVDVAQQPHLAEAANIIVTPTVVRDGAEPRRVVGRVDDADRVAAALGLHQPGRAQ